MNNLDCPPFMYVPETFYYFCCPVCDGGGGGGGQMNNLDVHIAGAYEPLNPSIYQLETERNSTIIITWCTVYNIQP